MPKPVVIIGGILIVIVIILKNSPNPDSVGPERDRNPPSPVTRRPRPAPLTVEDQGNQCRAHIGKYSKDLFSDVRIRNVNDLRPDIQVIKYHTCATEAASGIPRSYIFVCNFSFYGESFKGAPLSMVQYGLEAWPYTSSELGPVYNMTAEQKSEEDASRADADAYYMRNLSRDPQYRTDPCNGQLMRAQ